VDNMKERLAACFAAVFSDLEGVDITRASVDSLANWDSVATVTLITVVEEEFNIATEIDDPAQFDSFQGILEYLRRQIGVGEAAGELV